LALALTLQIRQQSSDNDCDDEKHSRGSHIPAAEINAETVIDLTDQGYWSLGHAHDPCPDGLDAVRADATAVEIRLARYRQPHGQPRHRSDAGNA
jgi:hypothetical protein